MPATRRRLATFLFLDIVGSTRIASDIGDERWRSLLNRFRRIVRAELKRSGGREEDTAGDGFFATFGEPAQAVRAAEAIARAVQDLGIDIRCGIHTGEGEVVDGHLAGVGVHLAARVMALAGSAEILVTATVKDLVLGIDVTFEDRGTHELKGVPGTWQVFSVVEVGGVRRATPLERAVADERLAGVVAQERAGPRRTAAIVASVLTLLVAVVALLLLTRHGGGDRAAPPEPVHQLTRVAVAADDTMTVTHGVDVAGTTGREGGWLGVSDGTVWNARAEGLVGLDPRTGAELARLDWPTDDVTAWGFGFGSAWFAHPTGGNRSMVEQVDITSGRTTGRLRVSGAVVDIDGGSNGVWILTAEGILRRVDPAGPRLSGSWEIGGVSPSGIVPEADLVWIDDPVGGYVFGFDARAGAMTTTASVPNDSEIVGSEPRTPSLLWVSTRATSTIASIQIGSGRSGPSQGIGGPIGQARAGMGAVFVAAGSVLFRYDIGSRETTSVAMPPGFLAEWLAVDPTSRSVWVGNCVCPELFPTVAPSSTP